MTISPKEDGVEFSGATISFHCCSSIRCCVTSIFRKEIRTIRSVLREVDSIADGTRLSSENHEVGLVFLDSTASLHQHILASLTSRVLSSYTTSVERAEQVVEILLTVAPVVNSELLSRASSEIRHGDVFCMITRGYYCRV